MQKLTAWFDDNAVTSVAVVELRRTTLGSGVSSLMASVRSIPSGGVQSVEESSVTNKFVQNQFYVYHLFADISLVANKVELRYVQIEYTQNKLYKVS